MVGFRVSSNNVGIGHYIRVTIKTNEYKSLNLLASLSGMLFQFNLLTIEFEFKFPSLLIIELYRKEYK